MTIRLHAAEAVLNARLRELRLTDEKIQEEMNTLTARLRSPDAAAAR